MPERETTPTEPALKMLPGMMPILHWSGVSTPGQFGPISRDLEPASERLTCSVWKVPCAPVIPWQMTRVF